MNHSPSPLNTIQLRPSQKKILAYRRGKMGIAAVPGSGKTFTLSLLAAQLIREVRLEDDQEILVVTLVNSAVDNFYQRVSQFVASFGLLPNLGYQVRTLHSLAHDIVRERPTLVGLPENFTILDERAPRTISAMRSPTPGAALTRNTWKTISKTISRRANWRNCSARTSPSWSRSWLWPSSARPKIASGRPSR